MAYKPNMEDIKKLRTMTGAGLADVKKALTDAEGDFNKAMEIIREKGQAIAATARLLTVVFSLRLLKALLPSWLLSVRPTSLPTVLTTSS